MTAKQIFTRLSDQVGIGTALLILYLSGKLNLKRQKWPAADLLKLYRVLNDKLDPFAQQLMDTLTPRNYRLTTTEWLALIPRHSDCRYHPWNDIVHSAREAATSFNDYLKVYAHLGITFADLIRDHAETIQNVRDAIDAVQQRDCNEVNGKLALHALLEKATDQMTARIAYHIVLERRPWDIKTLQETFKAAQTQIKSKLIAYATTAVDYYCLLQDLHSHWSDAERAILRISLERELSSLEVCLTICRLHDAGTGLGHEPEVQRFYPKDDEAKTCHGDLLLTALKQYTPATFASWLEVYHAAGGKNDDEYRGKRNFVTKFAQLQMRQMADTVSEILALRRTYGRPIPDDLERIDVAMGTTALSLARGFKETFEVAKVYPTPEACKKLKQYCRSFEQWRQLYQLAQHAWQEDFDLHRKAIERMVALAKTSAECVTAAIIIESSKLELSEDESRRDCKATLLAKLAEAELDIEQLTALCGQDSYYGHAPNEPWTREFALNRLSQTLA